MGETEILQDILRGQAAMQESMKSMAEMVREVREDSRQMRQTISENSQMLVYTQAEMKHLREDHERADAENIKAHDLIKGMIKEEVEIAWKERRRCVDERRDDRDKLIVEIMEKDSLKLERMKARTTVAILVYALSVIAFFVKETFFK